MEQAIYSDSGLRFRRFVSRLKRKHFKWEDCS